MGLQGQEARWVVACGLTCTWAEGRSWRWGLGWTKGRREHRLGLADGGRPVGLRSEGERVKWAGWEEKDGGLVLKGKRKIDFPFMIYDSRKLR